MNFAEQNKDTLTELANLLELEVEAAGKKPTKDELIVALEAAEKEDPEAFKAAVELLDTEEEDEEDDTDEDGDPTKGQVFTYVGAGEQSPRKIDFMGQKEFIRGRPVVVTEKHLIKKIKGNPSFRPGKVSEEEIQVMEDEAAEHADAVRKADKIINRAFKKKHMTGKDD